MWPRFPGEQGPYGPHGGNLAPNPVPGRDSTDVTTGWWESGREEGHTEAASPVATGWWESGRDQRQCHPLSTISSTPLTDVFSRRNRVAPTMSAIVARRPVGVCDR